MPNDPRIKWAPASPFGIQNNEAEDAWWSGRVTDVLELDGGDAGLLVATETGGVWSIASNGATTPLSDSWNEPDVNCLAAGPDGSRHFFAGCMRGIIYETDPGAPAPILNWAPVSPALPAAAGNVNALAVLRLHRRIIAACDGGVYWSMIPKNAEPSGCFGWLFPKPAQPRPPYQWVRATEENLGQGGYYGLAIGSLSGKTESPGDEELRSVSVIAGGHSAGVFIGRWRDANTLELNRVVLLDEQDQEITDWWFLSTGATSVAACEKYSNNVYAACAYPDGRFKMVIRSKDGGRRWHITGFDLIGVPGQSDVRSVAGDQGTVVNAGRPNNGIGVMPTNPGMVAFGWVPGVFQSPDSGKSWRLISGTDHLHADVRAVKYKPTTLEGKHFLYIGSDGGLAQVDLDAFGLGNVVARSDYNRTLATLQCYATYVSRQFYGTMAVSHAAPTLGWLATGVHDNGNIYSDIAAGMPWRRISGGDGGDNTFLSDGSLVFNWMGGHMRAATPGGAGLLDAGAPPINVPPPPQADGLLSPACEPVRRPRFRDASGRLMRAVAATGADVYGLFRDDDTAAMPTGYNWQRLASLPVGLSATAIASHTGRTVFVGTSNGGVMALDTAQATWFPQPMDKLPSPGSGAPPHIGGVFYRIATLSERVAFATLNASSLGFNYVYRLDGFGWKLCPAAGLPTTLPFYGIDGYFQEERTLVAVSTDDRVYLSDDAGENWVQASGGLPRRPHCAELRVFVNSDESWLYLSTFGRSVWRARLGQARIE